MQPCCCICLEQIDMVSTHDFNCCKGKMHQACFQLLKKSKTKHRCPYCRTKLTKTQKKQIQHDDDDDDNADVFNVLDYM